MDVVLAHAGFADRPRRTAPDLIVVHEPVIADAGAPDLTERVLKRRGLGVHFAVGTDGVAYELAPVDRVEAHAGTLNGRSIGIEVLGAYLPDAAGRAPKPWQEVIRARWAWKGAYVLPLPIQLETLWRLVEQLVATTPIPMAWAGLVGTRFAMGLVKGANVAPGIQAHVYTAHADGGWPVLYCWLRHRGLDATTAYATAKRLATGAGAWLDVSPILAKNALPEVR